MLKRILIIFVLALTQAGCDTEYGANFYPFSVEDLSSVRTRLEREKRELLKIEEIRVGNEPVAAWGRRIKADIEVRYTDGSIVYNGPIVTYYGFEIGLTTGDGLKDSHLLSNAQPGIDLGLNGMAVGGQRRIIIDRQLVCSGLPLNDHGTYGCPIVLTGRQPGDWPIRVRKENLVVEATLTESCIPLSFRAIRASGSYLIYRQIGCRNAKEPTLNPNAPVWTVY